MQWWYDDSDSVASAPQCLHWDQRGIKPLPEFDHCHEDDDDGDCDDDDDDHDDDDDDHDDDDDDHDHDDETDDDDTDDDDADDDDTFSVYCEVILQPVLENKLYFLQRHTP